MDILCRANAFNDQGTLHQGQSNGQFLFVPLHQRASLQPAPDSMPQPAFLKFNALQLGLALKEVRYPMAGPHIFVSPPGTAKLAEEADKLSVSRHAFKTVASQLLLLQLLAEYLQFLDIMPTLAVEVAHRVVELIKVLISQLSSSI